MDIKYRDWQIVRKIGTGSSGVVYEIARTDQFGDTFRAALKVISIPQSDMELRGISNEMEEDEQAIADFLWGEVEVIDKEVKLMYQLRGFSNIVNFQHHEIVPHENSQGWNVLIEMELLTSLSEYAKVNGLKRSDIIRIGIDICSALEYCEQMNIIHRDIKPDNILVNDNGMFKLADFGVARMIDKTMSGLSQRKGTYNYMAPEVYNGDAYGFTVDLYSLGLVLYRYLNNNKAPFRPMDHQPTHSEVKESLKRRMRGEPLPAPCNEQGRLADIVLKACAGNPKERYRTATEMKLDLMKLLVEGGEDVTILPPRQTKGDNKSVKTTDSSFDSRDISCLSNTTGVSSDGKNFDATVAVNVVEDVSDATVAMNFNKDISDETVSAGLGIDKTVRLNLDVKASTEENKESTEKKKKPVILIVALLCLLLCGGAGFGKVLNYYQSTTKVPDVSNMTTDRAKEVIIAAGLIPYEGQPQNSDKTDKNLVIYADHSGERVALQSEIVYYVSLGDLITVPVVTGMNDEEAKEILESSLLKVTAKLEYSDTVEKGRVISQKPESGSKLNEDETITIIISKGKEPIELMDYTGKKAINAKSKLEKLGLKVETSERFSTSVKNGVVINQNPDAKAKLYKGDTVKLVVSKGPEQVKVPNLLGLTKSEAESKLKKAGLKLANVNEDYSSSYTKGQVMKQGYEAGEKVDKGTGISIRISLGEKPEETTKAREYTSPTKSYQPIKPPVIKEPVYATNPDDENEVIN